jgi:hypothetical protein
MSLSVQVPWLDSPRKAVEPMVKVPGHGVSVTELSGSPSRRGRVYG